jgi:hypothetical protein
MSKFAEWLRHVAGILSGKAELLDGLDAKVKSEINALLFKRMAGALAVGFLVGYIVRGM